MRVVLSRNRYLFSLAAAAASWGVATVISKDAVDEIPPLTLLPIQLAVSVVALAVVIWTRGLRVSWSPELRRLGALGVLNPGVSYALGLLGLAQITASLSVLLWATEPLMILVLAWWYLGDRIGKPLIALSALALAGVALVTYEPGSSGQLGGVLLTLAGVAACAIYTVVVRKLIANDSTLSVVMLQQVCALLFSMALLAVTVLFGVSASPADVSVTAWVSAVLSGLLYYAAGFWFYVTGLRRVAASVAGMFLTLIPIFGIAAGHILLGEVLTPRQWFGAVLIVTAMGAIARSQLATPSSLTLDRPHGEAADEAVEKGVEEKGDRDRDHDHRPLK